jgi:dihydroorotate dehydrogenase (fumarate)
MDLSTSYLGLRLAHPYMAGASPMTANLDGIKRLEDAGCSAIVMHSLFEEQITMEESGTVRHKNPLDEQFAGALAYFQAPAEYRFAPKDYVEHLRRAKEAVGVPVIGSLNGTSGESWLKYGRMIQDAGADALEVNIYEVVTDLGVPGVAIETMLRDLVKELKRELRIPVAVKLAPFFSAFGNLARQLDEAGADALVIFNRFYQPDIDIRDMSVRPNLELSRSAELLLRLRWLAILHGRIRAALAVTGGVEIPADGIKALLAGADAVQMVSSILRHGPAYFGTMREALARWMEWHHLESIGDVRGRVSLLRFPDASAFERANYIRALHSWGK